MSTFETKVNLKINPLQVVWKTQKTAVEHELQEILRVEELDPSDLGCFQQCNTAAKCVIDKMNEQEKAEFSTKIEEIRAEGNPEPIQCE